MESIDQVTGFDQHGRARLDRCNDDHIGLAQMIASRGHHSCDLWAGGTFCSCWSDAQSARRRRVAHSLTTRKAPRKPLAFRRRPTSAPLQQPELHSSSSNGRYASIELCRIQKISVLSPRITIGTAKFNSKLRRPRKLPRVRQYAARPPRTSARKLEANATRSEICRASGGDTLTDEGHRASRARQSYRVA
jgi:hypothetical protein